MTSTYNTTHSADRQDGQALVEFALSLPILLLFIMGLIDFSVMLFSYSQAQSSMRSALRYAQLIGHSETERPYLNCSEMTDRAEESFFATTHNVNISYVKADGSGTYTCSTVSNDVLVNGDMLQMTLTANIDPFFLPYDHLTLDFTGQRSIVKLIGFNYDPSTTPPDPPAQPTNFTAISDGEALGTECVTGDVSFTWDTLNPRPTKVQVHDADSDALVFTLDPAMNNYCTDCDSIDPDLGYRCYYAVAYNNAVAGAPSAPVCTYCIDEPAKPINFSLLASAEPNPDCITGDVSFDWDWGEATPPTKAEIRDADTGAVVKEILVDLFSAVCDADVTECDTLPLPGSRTYTIVAINEAGGEERESVPSDPLTVSCTLADMTSVSGKILQDGGTLGDCADYGTPLTNATVELTNTTTGVTDSILTDGDGYFYFVGLAPGTYTLNLPTSVTYTDYTTGGAFCQGPVLPLSITLNEGDVLQYTFGYQ